MLIFCAENRLNFLHFCIKFKENSSDVFLKLVNGRKAPYPTKYLLKQGKATEESPTATTAVRSTPIS
jgi:hypothetical protein